MKKIFFLTVLSVVVISLVSFKKSTINYSKISVNDTLLFDGEKHFANMQQLTFGGDNASNSISPSKCNTVGALYHSVLLNHE